ncbi:conserved hypothetical protein [Cupriavidus taiwanensis]|uniref:DUF4224 domain-containing protein n=1 Tax=Cupriavidus taiwanensis TaxID=164546 RepID=UPI000E19C5F5|nr:DUF4224 domain-containing protein [Cupriavidus taiwanensis]SPA40185.1 conserved hypothetical protein [Cupriavidus taiwanensis]
MDSRLLTEKDLQDVTGKKRPSAQLDWFKRCFGFQPPQRADGRIILPWTTFEALQAKLAGVAQVSAVASLPPEPRPMLAPIRRAR